MDSLGYFGKWFPTEHKKYTAIIAMMYVGVVTTVLGVLFEIALQGLAMIGLFGGPAGIRRTMDVLTFFSGLNTLVTLALLVIMIYLLYKTRALAYLLKMFLGYFVVDLLLMRCGNFQWDCGCDSLYLRYHRYYLCESQALALYQPIPPLYLLRHPQLAGQRPLYGCRRRPYRL